VQQVQAHMGFPAALMHPIPLAIVDTTSLQYQRSDHQVQNRVQAPIVPHDVLQATAPSGFHSLYYCTVPVVFWFHGPTVLHPSGVSAATAFPPFA
jgi:hypothetical protein